MKIKKTICVIEHLKRKLLIVILFMIAIIFIAIMVICSNHQTNQYVIQVSTINTKQIKQIQSEKTESVGEEEIQNLRETIHLKEYANMPEKIDEYKVIGKIEIPKIKIEKYILEKTDEKSLKKSVTKICGPNINRTGNFCIAGHNYQTMFGKLTKLENGDIIKLTDTYDRTVSYKVYSIQKVSPTDTDCLLQETNGEREVTLVTCTLGAVKRVVVKAIEVYD